MITTTSRIRIGALAAATGLALGGAAFAEDCECDCYFSGDCPIGNFCDWGNLTIEDNCWWRRPKPEGQIGAGCGEDYGDWGQCDGQCASSAAPMQLLQGETRENVIAGIDAWFASLHQAARTGGGTPDPDSLLRVEAIDFQTDGMDAILWRFTQEAIIYAVGLDVFEFPKDVQAYPHTAVAIRDLSSEPERLRNMELVVHGLLASIREPGAGNDLLAQVNPAAMDLALYSRFCDVDPMTCLHERIGDLALVLAQAPVRDPQAIALGSGPNCGGCPADLEYDDVVNFTDVLALLSGWGSGGESDIDGDGTTGFNDLLAMLSSWGGCRP